MAYVHPFLKVEQLQLWIKVGFGASDLQHLEERIALL